MYLTVCQQLKHLSKEEFLILRELCHTAKNLTNQAIFNVRQHYFELGKFLTYEKNYALLKTSENYKILNSNMAQQILKEVDGSFRSFFGLLKLAKQGNYAFQSCKLPHYLPKDGYATLVIGFVRLHRNQLILPYSNAYKKAHKPVCITIPPILTDKTIKEIRIIPRSDARFFEIQYTYQAEMIQRNLNPNHELAIDFGIDNLMTAVSNRGESFIIDGRRLKSLNQWFNKQYACLQSIKDKQHFGRNTTKHQAVLQKKRNNQIRDYMSKAAQKVIQYCIRKEVGTLIVGYNTTFQRSSNLGRQMNQIFVNIPFGILRRKLKYLCELNGIRYVEQEESYTSKASFWDQDKMPVYGALGSECPVFSGQRIYRGVYKNHAGKRYHADINGALNIMRKSNIVSLDALYARGDVDTPVRIRIA